MKVYLTGAIANSLFSEQSDWRIGTAEVLREKGFEVAWSLRLRDYDSFYGSVAKDHEERKTEPFRELLVRDYRELISSDVLFVNFLLSPHQPSLGSCIEIGRAEVLSIPIISVISPESVHDHISIVDASDYIFLDMDEAIEFLIKMKDSKHE